MTMDETIARINAIYHLSQERELTPEEKEEQAQLRKRYIESVRGNLRAQLENIEVERPDGSVEKLKKKGD